MVYIAKDFPIPEGPCNSMPLMFNLESDLKSLRSIVSFNRSIYSLNPANFNRLSFASSGILLDSRANSLMSL